jgi:hypothetical protein
MSIKFPVVPSVPGIPPILTFPGTAAITGAISGTVLSVTSGLGVIAPGLALSGMGVTPGTVLTSGLTAITDGVGIAGVNLSQTVASVAMQVTGSLSDLLPDLGDVLGQDTVSALLTSSDQIWGIFLDGAAVVIPDSVVSLDYKKDWHISDYPIEQGNFESYNKVRLPYEAKVQITKGGTVAERNDFLQTIESIAASLDLYDIVTPEVTYINANITHFDYRRTSVNGVSLLTIALWFQEIRAEASSEFINSAQPSGSDQVNSGVVQPQAPTPAETASFTGGATGAW